MNNDRDYSLDAIIGASPALLKVRPLIAKVAASPATTVLLSGDTGTGKDLAATVIHRNSARRDRPFVTITCAAVPEQLLESELFGHECGAFTDARRRKPGLLETADGGTVFLDEIGSAPLPLQVKLLRFLEERTFRRVGGLEDLHVNVRVIAATNRSLEDAVADKSFRDDLFHRLRVMAIRLPPLRDRTGDVPLLAHHFVGIYNQVFGRHVRGLSREALRDMEQHEWPGNVRELRNVIERAMLLNEGEWVRDEDLDLLRTENPPMRFRLPEQGLILHEVERELVVQALDRSSGNHTRAAHLLGINRDQVRYRIAKFGIANHTPVVSIPR